MHEPPLPLVWREKPVRECAPPSQKGNFRCILHRHDDWQQHAETTADALSAPERKQATDTRRRNHGDNTE